MTEVQDIPVSVTYTGKTMQRNEVVDYLQQLCTYHMAFDELSEQYERRTKEFEAVEAVKEKYDSTKWKVPSETAPKENYIGVIIWAGIIVLIARWFLGFSTGLIFRGVVIAIAAGIMLIFYYGEKDNCKRECAAWKKEKEDYAQKLKWFEEQKASYVDGKPKEVVDAEKALMDVRKMLEFARIRRWHYESEDILPKELLEWPVPAILSNYFSSGRVNTLSEAINLFYAELHNQRMQQLQEEIRTRQEAMIMQQNLNAARLSEQINTAKNEIEMDNFIQSCFVQDRLDSIYREVLDQR